MITLYQLEQRQGEVITLYQNPNHRGKEREREGFSAVMLHERMKI